MTDAQLQQVRAQSQLLIQFQQEMCQPILPMDGTQQSLCRSTDVLSIFIKSINIRVPRRTWADASKFQSGFEPMTPTYISMGVVHLVKKFNAALFRVLVENQDG